MKRVIKCVMFLLVVFPLLVKAVTCENLDATTLNNYLKNPTYEKTYNLYLNINSAELLKEEEYNLTKLDKNNDGSSYLFDGYNYCAKSKDVIKSIPNINNAKIRVVETVKSTSKVTGRGTRINPWVFSPNYLVNIKSNGHGKIALEKDSTDPYDSVSINTINEDAMALYLYPDDGLVYLGNSCNFKPNEDNTYLLINNVNGNLNCEVLFGEEKYVVSLNGNGGTLQVNSLMVKYNENYNYYGTNLPLPIKTGYKFLGWYTEDNKLIEDEDKVTIRDNHTLYAKYEEEIDTRCNVIKTIDGYTFDGWYTAASGGSKVINSSGRFLANVDGYTDSNGNYIKPAAITLYAHYLSLNYDVLFNCNTGSGAMEPQGYTYGKAQALKANTCTKTGYTFNGWNTKQDGTGTKYTDKQSVSNLTVDENIEIYAQWKANSYTLTLKGNTATTAGTGSVSATYDSNTFKAITLPKKTNYIFDGYYTEADAESGIKVIDSKGAFVKNVSGYTDGNGNYKKASALTLYAHWLQEPYTVHFDCNGGSGTIEDQVFENNAKQALNANNCTRTENTFKGWSKDPKATTATYTDKQSVNNLGSSDESNVTLYAVWTAKTYKVKYDANSGKIGSATTKTLNVPYEAIKGELGTVSKAGSSLEGWYTEKEGGIKVAKPDGYYEKNVSGYTNSKGEWIKITSSTEVTTLYAHWVTNTYTVTLDNNNATEEGSTSFTIEYNTSNISEITNPEREGYTFGGWSTAASGGTVIVDTAGSLLASKSGYTNGSKNWINQKTDLTLYAKWTANEYVITLDGNGQTTAGTGSIKFTYDKSYTTAITMTIPKKTGYDFQGWYTTSGEDGIQIIDSAKKLVADVDGYSSSTPSWKKANNITLYAKWTPQKLKITFNANSGTLNTTTINATYDSSDVEDIINPVRSGYTFLGWYSATASTGLRVIDANGNYVQDVAGFTGANGEWKKDKAVTLYAKWDANSYIVTLDNIGATTVGSSSIIATYALIQSETITNPLKTGYDFQGWYTEKTGGSVVIKTNGAYAKSVAGYTNGNDTPKWIGTEDKTLYAQWKAKTYTITLKGNGATTGGSGSVVATYDSPQTKTITNPKKTSYNFEGWFTTADGGVKVIDVNGNYIKNVEGFTDFDGNWVKAEAATLYAHYVKNTYIVELNCNGGVGETQTLELVTGESKALPVNICTKIENTYLGWALEPTATAKKYADKATVSNLAAYGVEKVVLYAVWKPNNYTVTLNRNGGSNGSASVSVPYGSKNVKITLPTKSGYTHIGYYTEVSGGTLVINPDGFFEKNISGYTNANGEWIKNSASTLYAQWSNSVYEIALNNNKATTEGSTNFNVVFNATTITTITNPIRTGYTFDGWSTAASGGTVIVDTSGKLLANKSGWTDASGRWIKKSNSTLYAKWTANKYTVTYDGNGQTSGTMANSSHTYDTAKALTANAYKKTGYSFAGWSKTKDGQVDYKNSQSVTNLLSKNNDNITLYAIWTAQTYKITLNKNDGAGETQSYVTATYDSAKLPAILNPLKGETTTGLTVSVQYVDEEGNALSDAVLVGRNLKNTDSGTIKIKDYSGVEHSCSYTINKYDCKPYEYACGTYTCPVACGSYPCGTTRICTNHDTSSGGIGNCLIIETVPVYCTAYCDSTCTKYCTGYKTCYR